MPTEPTLDDKIRAIRVARVGADEEINIALSYVQGQILLSEAAILLGCSGKNPSATAYRKLSSLLREAFLVGRLSIKL